MKKLITTLLSLTIALVPLQVAQANDQKVLAIIDTAIDSKKVSSVIYEACFTQNQSCPNKSNFMEGIGSAASPVWPKSITSDVYHGHNVTQAALVTSPDIKIVFVRIANVTATGGSLNQPQSIMQAIDWVSKNALKYSIDAVSISQSSISTNNLARCTTDTITINAVSTLNNNSVPVFAATGNDGLLDKVGFPSCVSGVVGVGALASTSSPKLPSTYTIFAKSTNRGPGLDIVAQGDTIITRYNGTSLEAFGTSIASPIAASLYVNKNTDRNVNNFIGTFSKVLIYPYISK
jgi:subtilisin